MARARRYALATRVRLEVYTVEAGTVMRDLHRLSLELFASRATALGYVGAVGVLGLHLAWGWAKATPRLGLEKRHVARATALGQALVAFITLGFAASPLYVHFGLLAGGAAAL